MWISKQKSVLMDNSIMNHLDEINRDNGYIAYTVTVKGMT